MRTAIIAVDIPDDVEDDQVEVIDWLCDGLNQVSWSLLQIEGEPQQLWCDLEEGD